LPNQSGNREVKGNIRKYNLDVIIAIGYQVNSVLGIKFRIWATKTKICAICFFDTQIVSALTSAFNSTAPFFSW
jgi:hypothetical protein